MTLTDQQQPFTAEEAEALARGMRIEARLPRIAVAGTVLGLICGIAAISPLLASDDPLAHALARERLFPWLQVLLPILLAWLLPLLAFYSARLQFCAGRMLPGEIEECLRIIRWILVACMCAAVSTILIELMNETKDAGIVLVVVYVLCVLACGSMTSDVRKALGEFDTAERRRRRRMARGFAVELPAAAHDGAPRPVLPVDVQLPARTTPISVAGAIDAHRDLRSILHALAAIGILLFCIRLPVFLADDHSGRNVERAIERVADIQFSLSSLCLAASGMAKLALGLIGSLWIPWGLVVLGFGARLRHGALLLAWITLVSAVIATFAPMLPSAALAAPGSRSMLTLRLDSSSLSLWLAEMVYGLAMIVVLTRPHVVDLFTRGSETAES